MIQLQKITSHVTVEPRCLKLESATRPRSSGSISSSRAFHFHKRKRLQMAIRNGHALLTPMRPSLRVTFATAISRTSLIPRPRCPTRVLSQHVVPSTSIPLHANSLPKTVRVPRIRLQHTSASDVDDGDTKTLLIVYYSMTDGTRQMAQAAYDAACTAEGVRTRMLRAEDAGPDDLLSASGYIFATPENLAAIAGVFKAFVDRSYYPVLGKTNGRPYAAMICAGSDGTNALRQLDRIALGWRMKMITPGIIVCTHAQTPERIYATKTIEAEDLARCAEIGQAMAEGLALGVF